MGRRRGENPFSQTDYYRRNKEKILAERRRRYRKDREYRERIRQRAREVYEESKPEKPTDRHVFEGRNGQRFISIGKLGQAIDRRIQTIRWYHRSGLFPPPLYHDKRGWRLYSVNQALMLKNLFERYDAKEITTDELRSSIHSQWRK